jgi:phosphoribosylanthranilate isomerase
MFRVKICGITNERDAFFATRFGADALGFIFYRKSPRRILPLRCKQISKKINPFVLKVGVFVNEKKQKVMKILRSCRLQAVQFHGDETPSYCNFFKKKVLVIKAFSLKNEETVEKMKEYDVDAYLIDTYDPHRKGGTGKVFSLKLARCAAKLKKPLILSGGLTPENVLFYLREIKPEAVDVASGVEAKPGIKNLKKMKLFLQKVKNYDT